MFVFGKFDVLCFLETPVLRFALLSYYRRIMPVLSDTFYGKNNQSKNLEFLAKEGLELNL